MRQGDSWLVRPVALAAYCVVLRATAMPPTPHTGAIQTRDPLRICRIYPGGVRGPWIPYVRPEGMASCLGRGFDAIEPALPPYPCGTVGFADGAAEGGVDPFCAIPGAMPGCPIEGRRWLFGTFGIYATGSSTHPLNPPAYAVGQDVCELDFAFTENAMQGQTVIDVVWHSTFNAIPPDCGTQPLVGDIVDGVGLDFGPATGGVFYAIVDLDGLLPPPLPVMPPPGGAYSFYYWSDVGASVVSHNSAPLGWGPKNAAFQGSSGYIGYQNDDFSTPSDDNGSQYEPATECFDFSAGTLCPQPVIVAAVRLGVAQGPLVSILSANPPAAAQNGGLPFRDVLENTTTSLNPQGIGVAGTPAEGPIVFAPFQLTFTATVTPAPSVSNISVSCTDSAGNGQADCPTVTNVAGNRGGPYLIILSTAPPVRECTTFTFVGTLPGQKLQYQNLPGDVNRNGSATGQDVLALIAAINFGTANADRARFDINRSGIVTGQDVIRLVQLLNGGITVVPATGYNAAAVAACPP